MKESDYKLWLDYHYGKINRKLSEKEYNEIRACEFAMHLLIPTNSLLKVLKRAGFYDLESMDIYHNDYIIEQLAEKFIVPKEVMFFKLEFLLECEKNNEKSIKKKVLKKVDKIIKRWW